MSNTPKVVPIAEDRCKEIAEDPRTRRFILGVGKHRFAFDFATRVTELAEGTGDQPAPVVQMKTKKRDRPK